MIDASTAVTREQIDITDVVNSYSFAICHVESTKIHTPYDILF
jgi:hypothetical protein